MKFGFFTMIVSVTMMMFSCGGKTEKVPFDDGDSLEIAHGDPTIYGVCGEGTAMNTLQLITDMGDTLSIDIADAQENGKVFGGMAVGDRMAVVPTDDKLSAVMVINQATLLGNWVMPNPLDGSDEVGISIKEGGIAESIDLTNITYKTWRLTSGRLEIVLVREGGSEEDETCFYDLVKLGADSLVYKNEEETFEYTRQQSKKGYGVDIKLEDSQNEFFM